MDLKGETFPGNGGIKEVKSVKVPHRNFKR